MTREDELLIILEQWAEGLGFAANYPTLQKVCQVACARISSLEDELESYTDHVQPGGRP